MVTSVETVIGINYKMSNNYTFMRLRLFNLL